MNKPNLIHKINKKLGKAVPIRQLFDIVEIINLYIYDEIINNRPIHIDKFGTISQMILSSKKTWSRFKNQYIMSSPSRKLVFRPHVVFKKLIQLKRKNLEKSKK